MLFTTVIILIVFISLSILVKFVNNRDVKADEEFALDMEEKVWSYLFEKGYKEEEIYDLEVKFNSKIGNVSDAYYVYVVFVDDKEMTYVYEQINGKVVQTGFSGPDDVGKHAE